MSSNVAVVLKQIDDLLAQHGGTRAMSKWDDLSDLSTSLTTEVNTRLMAGIRRYAPNGSAHRDGAEALVKQYGVHNSFIVEPLLGVLRALRADYSAGYLSTVEELIHADLFSDFLEMAEHLLNQGYKDPSAVLVGSVLEEHLRKLCLKNGLPVSVGSNYKKADTLNADLAGASVYSKLDQKSITAWLDLRNKAAHGKYAEYTKDQVQLMLDGVRNFMARNAA